MSQANLPNQLKKTLLARWRLFLSAFILGGYWLLPISGQVTLLPGKPAAEAMWPHIYVAAEPTDGDESLPIVVEDTQPWANVLLTVDGQPARFQTVSDSGDGTWRWHWLYTSSPSARGGADIAVAFYRDCNTGCRERGRIVIPTKKADSATGEPATVPTKLGAVFADPRRDWHGRAGWTVDLSYASTADEESYWGLNEVAARVEAANAKGLRVLLRVDYDRNQSLPSAGDEAALQAYLRHLRRLARDDRLQGVYGFVVGSGYNAFDANAQAPDRPVTPAWYARLFDGYGQDAARADNVVQVVKAANPQIRVLVGPARPWVQDQGGERPHVTNAPWLNYMNTLVADLDEGTKAKAAAGIPLVAPDGFALQAPGRPATPEMQGRAPSAEPGLDLYRADWGGAQVGFRVYQDWLSIINAYTTTRGLPAYITSTNTYAPDEGTPPAENYPPGWLTTALHVVDQEPQIQALCWFIDGPLADDQWDPFSLARPTGNLQAAADEFDQLLRAKP
ncbi:MAG: hypothetical protein M0Z94_09020 [Dehalococcoidales bacterium]|nr:hypothetical protein [Dehalococcoidales bacterium]